MPPLPYLLATLLILLTTAFVRASPPLQPPTRPPNTLTSQLRLIYILPSTHRARPPPRKRGTPTHLLIVLGSGGHTAEMLSLLHGLDPTIYTHRTYIISSGDDFSAARAAAFESTLLPNTTESNGISQEGKKYSIHTVPRARRIHQSLLSAPLTSLHCFSACLTLLHAHPQGHPDLILTNGPATSLILLLASTLLRYFAFLPFLSSRSPTSGGPETGQMRAIYVESWARVKRPSLSGRIIVWCGLCDRVLVQWKGLEDRGWGEYRGVLVR